MMTAPLLPPLTRLAMHYAIAEHLATMGLVAAWDGEPRWRHTLAMLVLQRCATASQVNKPGAFRPGRSRS